jgi:putative ATPase
MEHLPADTSKPLAERMRPKSLNDFIGQTHVVGKGKLIRHAVEQDRVFSMILWGPPGCGKTTLAGIIAKETRSHFAQFSAVLSGVKEIRAVISDATSQQRLYRKRTILFVDEIHRFNKAQQDAFLHHVESGLITLIGATTENPSFEVIPPLLSRCRVITLHPLSENDIRSIIDRACAGRQSGPESLHLSIAPDAVNHLIRISEGDARTALNNLETAASLAASRKKAGESGRKGRVTLEDIEQALQHKALLYDKHGEEHYNLISAFHKSLRGSDPDAAVYWLQRMLSAGEDPFFVARRMVRFASEDVGNADPYALGVALSAMESYRFLGSPEGELALVQAAAYLATTPKSNSIYKTCERVKAVIEKSGALPVPLHIRNAPTRLMKHLGYSKGYKYDHDYKDAFAPQDYLPDQLKDSLFYFPSDRGYEKIIKQRLEKWRSLKQKSGPPKRS